jgi:oligogalacturonide lyase
MLRCLFVRCAFLAFAGAVTAQASNVGKRYASEKFSYVDPVTHLTVNVLTHGDASDSKPYQTHTTWTADGKWIIFRSHRGGGSGSQAFLVNETTGVIIQLTDAPGTGTGSLNLSRKEMKLYYMRGGPRFGPQAAETAAPPAPHQLIELNLAPLIADALAGTPKDASAYERVVATLPADLRDSGGFALDADETKAYWGVSWGPRPQRPARAAKPAAPGAGREIDRQNTDPRVKREAARERFAAMGKGPGGIRSIDLKTGEVKTVIDVDFRMGHVQTNPWVPGEIIYCHETTGDAVQRMWMVQSDGTGNRPLYVETPDEWITHETVSKPDEVMFSIMGHLPYLRQHPTGIAVINLRTDQMKIIAQVEENMPGGGTGGFWHVNGSPNGKFAVGDTFKGNIFVIDRKNGERFLLTTDHKMKPDHTHPIFSPDSRRVLIQSGHLTDGKQLNLMEVELPARFLQEE